MKNKILQTLLIPSLLIPVPTITGLVSCNNNSSDKLVSNIQTTMIDEFKWICTYYRRTFQNRWFCDMLQEHIQEMGFEVQTIEKTIANLIKQGKTTEAEAKKQYIYKLQDESTSYGYNMYFDIPATSGMENMPPLILQAHTDMVCVTKTDETTQEPIKYDWSKGIELETTGNWLHSKNYLTNIGADDGIGIAGILAFGKHKNDFKHGKIRCILTVDEEDGDSGARSMDPEWLDGFDYFLSLDGEGSKITWISAAGADQVYWTKGYEAVSPSVDAKEFDISMTGFVGGHSGLDMHSHHMNPLIIMGEALDKLSNTADYQNVRLVKSHDNSANENPNGGTIPDKVYFTIQANTEKSADDIMTLIRERIVEAKTEEPQSGEPDISKINVNVTKIDGDKSTNGLSVETTKKLTNLLCNYRTNHIYGEIELDEQKTRPITASSISAVRIGKDVTKADANTLYLEFMGRSHTNEGLKSFFNKETKSESLYIKAISDTLGVESIETEFKEFGFNSPWIHTNDNKMTKLIHQASESINNPITDVNCFGWLELAEIFAKKSTIQMGAIGPEVSNAHKPIESVDLSTIPTEIKTVLYIMQHLA